MKTENNETGKWQNSLTLKMGLLAIMGLFLLIPLEMIKDIIRERQMTSEEIKKEISFQWAGQQTISGPVLNIPLLIYPSKTDAKPYRSVYHIMPESLEIKGDVQTEKRHRSIYEAVVFTTDLAVSGEFSVPAINIGETADVLWEEAYYSVGISDNRGIKGSVVLNTEDNQIEAVPGLREVDLFESGLTFPVNMNAGTKEITFSARLKISGSESLNFTPLGKTTSIILTSPWNAPGFTGNFLPSDRTIDDNGFKANWLITNLNRNFPQSWNGKSYRPEADAFGTEFVLEADHYQKSLRSAKYGILFIALTFLAMLFVEFRSVEKIHIFHYLLLALGLVMFFSLLNALSEHTGFNIAYFIAAVPTVILISIFLKGLFKNPRPVMVISGLLVFLYSFIFILLTLKDYAYLAGNIGLFILLAITMKLSLNLKEE
jgi:inner membrane protein